MSHGSRSTSGSAAAAAAAAARSKSSSRFTRRRFHEVCILPCGHSSGKDRKIFQHEDVDESRLMQWRNNLTALSKRYNLYLVAGGARIWAYEPQYSSQHLTRHPQLSIETDRHPDARPGDIDPLRSDAINNIIIADFGEDEIVVCACDDGDVYAYSTRAIYDSIQRSKSDDPLTSASVSPRLRPFFHKNVTRSAWGLAVHQQSRLIAVSCNAHHVYVFAFALHHGHGMEHYSTDDLDPLDMSWDNREGTFDDWELHPHPDVFVKRDKDYVIRLESHWYNIPAVAFCNTSDDPEGRYLVSTDIAGTTFFWDIIERKVERKCLPSEHSTNPGGWALHFLDRRSFRRSDARAALTDKAMFAMSNAISEEFGLLDISRSRNVVARSKPWYPWPSGNHSVADDSADSDTDLDPDERRVLLEWDGLDEAVDEPDPFVDETETDGTATTEDDSSWVPGDPYPRSGLIQRIPHSGVEQHGAIDRSAFDACPHPSLVMPLPSRITGQAGPRPIPLSPLMRFTADNALLLQTAMWEHAPRHQPYMVFHGPLNQEVPADWVFLMRHIDRMNLTLQIDDLGLVLAGSPKGRVAVFSLHQIWPNPIVEVSPDPMFAFRLDAVLPLPAEEATQRRPSQPLVGVAAGPVQGHFGEKGEGSSIGIGGHGTARRYRIMLLYRDHSMLCYEVWRDREVTKNGVGTGVGRARDDVPFV